jgi:hypothetical protein
VVAQILIAHLYVVSIKWNFLSQDETYTDALFDKIVLVAFQLGFQSLRLCLVLLLSRIHPCSVPRSFPFLWAYSLQVTLSFEITLDIFALLSFFHS